MSALETLETMTVEEAGRSHVRSDVYDTIELHRPTFVQSASHFVPHSVLMSRILYCAEAQREASVKYEYTYKFYV